MPYGEAKIYHDGSHFIAIPYVPNPRRRRPKPPEEQIIVVDENADNETIDGLSESDEPTNETSEKGGSTCRRAHRKRWRNGKQNGT